MDTMIRESYRFESEQKWLELRLRDITSTDVSALFGVSPYSTAFELWHRKKNCEVVTLDPNERMKWGTRLQDSIAAGIAADNGWEIRRMDEYVRVPELRMGSSFDFSVERLHAIGAPSKTAEPESLSPPVGCGLLEVKNVDSLAFKKGWIVDEGSIEAPPHIELQVQHQLMVAGRDFAFIGALVGGNTVHLIRREPDPLVVEQIRKKVAEFWESIESGQAPAPDFSRDAATIARIYGYAEPGKVKDARGDAHFEALMEKYKKASEDEKDAKKRKDEVKGELLMGIGDAEKVIGDKFSISTGVVGPCHVEYDREGYRMFKPTFKN